MEEEIRSVGPSSTGHSACGTVDCRPMMSTDHPHSGSSRTMVGGAFLAAFTLLCLPFWFTPFIPIADLPQHLCQITLAKQVFSGEATHLVIQWYHPNTLVYLLVAAWMAVLPPIAAGKAVMISIMASWIGAVFYLAHQRRRSVPTAIIASILVFNVAWYWGFINFMVGWPVFVLLVARLGSTQRPVQGWELLVLSAALLLAHSLWFLMASLLLFLHCLFARHVPWPLRRLRLAWWCPGGLYALVWFVFFNKSVVHHRFNTAARWHDSPLERLDPSYLASYVFGGIPTDWTRLFLAGMVLWVIAAAITHGRDFSKNVDRLLLAVGGIIGFCSLVMPSSFMVTILFSARWMAIACALLILAVPAPRWPRAVSWAFALMLALAMGGVTSFHWRAIYQQGLPGLAESLEAVPPSAHVIGIDTEPTTKWIRDRPFSHMYAYAQALEGGGLNFSFSEHPSVLVVRKQPRELPWPFGVGGRASRMQDAHYIHFDVAMVHGSEKTQREFAAKPFLSALTTNGTWRAYQIDPHLVPEYTDEQRAP